MKPEDELSVFDIFVESSGIIMKPGMEAIKLRRDLNIQSVEDIPFAAERAGFEISYVDLPVKVSGFAEVFEGKPHIIVNRAKPPIHSKFTIAHELGHHHLHPNSLHDADQTGPLPSSATELEANMFATMLVATVTSGNKQEKMLAHNPEMRSALAVSVLGIMLAIFIAPVIWVCSQRLPTRDSVSIETK